MLKALIIDSREPEWARQMQFDSVTPVVQQLPAGDAWLACDDATLVVERKTLSDLVSSIADGRLFNQCTEMVKISPWSYIVVCGLPVIRAGKLHLAGKETNWSWASIQGALLTAQDLGVAVQWLESDAKYAPALVALSERSRAQLHVKARRDTTLQSPGEVVLTALPGIGTDRARAILGYAPSLAWALAWFTWDDDPAEHIPGIGPSTKALVRSLMGLDTGQILTVALKEKSDGK